MSSEMSIVLPNVQTWSRLLQEVREAPGPRPDPVFVTLTTPVPDVHPLALFSQAAGGDCFYWATPDRSTQVSAIGKIHQLQATGTDRFNALLDELKQTQFISNTQGLPAPLDAGPLLYGGFAFSPAAHLPTDVPADVWREFPDGLLVVPEFALLRLNGTTWLAQTTVLSNQMSDTALETLADRLSVARDRIQTRLTSTTHTGADQAGPTPTATPAPKAASPHSTFALSLDTANDEANKKWTHSVRQLTEAARQGGVIKTVLSRHVDVALPEPVVMERLLHQLEEEHPRSFIFSLIRGGHTFFGATPERLLKVEGRQLFSEALAGSTRRGSTATEDVALAHRLLHDDKERHEQKIVLDWLLKRLQRWCRSLHTPGEPSVRRFPTVQHLHTPIEGVLHEATHILDLVQAVHPTPAVGGYPLEDALSLILSHEEESRGWYAGPVGWCTPSGSGEFAVAIRSALVEGHRARLFAGCGIVDGSDPKRELAESRLKLGVIFDSLVRAFS